MLKRFTIDLPDELAVHLREDELASRAKESLVMEFLREHRISQGKAAEILGISRDDLFPLMTRHQVSVVDLTPEELSAELETPFPSV